MKKNRKNMHIKKTVNRKSKGNPGKVVRSDSVEYRKEKLKAVEKRKARSRAFSMTVLTVLIMFFTVLLIIGVMRRNRPSPEFMFITLGNIDRNVYSQAIIIRDENVYPAPASGIVKPVIREGKRVAHGQPVAAVIGVEFLDLLNELRNLEQQIATLQVELLSQRDIEGARAIYDEAERDISRIINRIRRDATGRRLVDIDTHFASISMHMQRRDVKLFIIDFNDSTLNELKSEKERLEREIGIKANTLTAVTAGLVSYHVDGMENTATPDMIMELDFEIYKDIIENSQTRFTAENEVEKNEDFLKIIKGISCYLVLEIDHNYEDRFPLNSKHNIYIPLTGLTLQNAGVVRKISAQERTLLVLETQTGLSNLSDKRVVEAEITVDTTHGKKVLISSLIDFDKDSKNAGVYIVHEGFVRKVDVNIIDYDNDHAIITTDPESEYSLRLYGYLVKNPVSVTKGENIGSGTR